jgi:type VI secretion system protein ImpA
MRRAIDLDAILAPLPGDNPAGEDMRYLPLYDEIKEARRADDLLDRGDWNRELKTADWDKVISLSTEALSKNTKDLQIAAWLFEALIRTEGFDGAEVGLDILIGFLEKFWEHVYPKIEDDDLDYRCGPLAFTNDKLSLLLKEIPLTNVSVSPGYSWLDWQDSVRVGKESDTLDKWGDVEQNKKKARDLLIEDGKPTAEQFESAAACSNRDFYEQLMARIESCQEKFDRLDAIVDEKFVQEIITIDKETGEEKVKIEIEAPKISDWKASLDDCAVQVGKILKEKRRLEPDPEPDSPGQSEEELSPSTGTGTTQASYAALSNASRSEASISLPGIIGATSVNRLLGSGGFEEARWQEAQTILKTMGIHSAVESLLGAACSAQSPREETNYHILIAKLCLQANRTDLAYPLAEHIYAQMEELQLERWESPIWIAEVLDILYRCLIADGASDDDQHRAKDILKKICTKDITKAMKLKS